MTTTDYIARVRERVAKATPGPWDGDYEGTKYDIFAENGDELVIVAKTGRDPDIPLEHEWPNMDLIAHCPSDLTRLCDMIEVALDGLKKADMTIVGLAEVLCSMDPSKRLTGDNVAAIAQAKVEAMLEEGEK